ncbi:MAG: hypothetical protein H6623_06420 [Bdellovibrionaceae bacterium]|nr:hypothetical protein [Pseudobdellovibrionaceae bacterium]
MKTLGLYVLFILFSVVEVRADVEAVVIEVRKNTALSKKEKIYKNYFINGGKNLGLKKGLLVDALRRLPVHDPLKNTSIGDLRIKVGTLEIIYSEEKISVGRIVSFESMDERPILDYEAIMIGDRLDLSTIRSAPVIEKTAQNLENPSLAEKVALLGKESKAESLIQEGERHLASMEMKTGAEPANSTVVARAPDSTQQPAKKVKAKRAKKKVKKALKKK